MHPGSSLTDAMREWSTPAAGLANYMEPPETFAARSEALVVKGSRPLGVNLGQQAQGWRSPTVRDGSGTGGADQEVRLAQGHSVGLKDQVTTWPTPRSSDGDKGGPHQALKGKPSLVALAHGHQGLATPTGGLESSPSAPTSRRLNPDFVEWLMGWPPGWSMPSGSGSTGFASSETESFLSRQQQRSRSSGFTSKGGSHE